MNSVVAYLQSTWYETGGKRNEWCACLSRAMSIKGNGVPQRAGSPTPSFLRHATELTIGRSSRSLPALLVYDKWR